MGFCKHCPEPIGRHESWQRIEAGTRLTDGTMVPHDVDVHTDCLGPYFVAHYPWLVKVRAAA